MGPAGQGALILSVTLLVLLSGAPVAFALGMISIVFLVFFQGFDALRVVAETFYGGLNDFTLVSIPMFVMMGAAIGSSPAGKDLYEALDRWLYRVPGGLVISNLGGARCSPRSRGPRRRPAQPSARWASRRCASAAFPTTWPPDRSAPGARSAS
jgi:hypothetical protein